MDKRNFSGVIGTKKESEQVLKATCAPLCQDSHRCGQLCEVSTVKKAARAPKVLIHHKSGTLLYLFIDLILQK